MTQISDYQTIGEESTSSSYRFVIAGLVLVAHLGVGVNFFVVSPLLPLVIQDYGISSATASLLIALALLVAAAFGLPGGALIARLGLGRVFTLGGFMVGLPVFSPIAPNYETLLVLRMGYGMGFALILTATGPLLMQWFSRKEFLAITSLNTAIISLGIALSVSTAAPIAAVIGWQNTLGIFGAVALLGAVAWVFFGRAAKVATGGDASRISSRELYGVLKNRAIMLLVVADAGVLVQYTALTSWLPTFYNEERGFSLSQAGFVTGLLPLVGVFAVLLGGYLPSRIGHRRMIFIVPGVMVVLGGLGSFLVGNAIGIYLAIILLGLGSWLYVPLLLSLPMELPGMTPEKVAIVWGSFVTVGGLGMFVAPILVGMLRDLSGEFSPGFLLCALAGWSLLAAGIFMPKDSL
ncbi:MAG: MFS transporter [Chloroflexi bacterium]|nr:MFS transporter [Chloroflexota bacterium]